MPLVATALELIAALGIAEGQWCATTDVSQISVQGVCVDSRELQAGQLFVARRGAARDSHDLLPEISTRAAVCLVDQTWFSQQPGAGQFTGDSAHQLAILSVPDTTKALGQLANWWRRKLDLKTVAVTGSNGKTSAKALLSSLLTQLVGKGTTSIKSFNNHVGLPLTILSSSADDLWLVLEAGMNHAGELDYLGAIAEPDVGVVLNIGPAHIESFGALSGIADAKCELLSRVRGAGTIVVNGDDSELTLGMARLQQHNNNLAKINRFGINDTSGQCDVSAHDVRSLGLDGTAFTLVLGKEEAATHIPHVGAHHVYNALASVAAARALFPALTLREFADTLPKVSRAEWRFQWERIGDTVLINDAYNANPASMKGAIQTVGTLAEGKPFALILGDMLELGNETAAYHREIGAAAGAVGASLVIALGDNANFVSESAKQAGAKQVVVASSPGSVATAVAEFGPFSYILVKGSRGMQLERVVDVVRGKLSALSSTSITS